MALVEVMVEPEKLNAPVAPVNNVAKSSADTFIFASDGEFTLFDMAINDNRCVSIIGDRASLVLDI